MIEGENLDLIIGSIPAEEAGDDKEAAKEKASEKKKDIKDKADYLKEDLKILLKKSKKI